MFAVDVDPRRAGRAPDGPVDAVVLCAAAASRRRSTPWRPAARCSSSPTRGAIPAARVYRRELTVVGTRSAAPRTCPRPLRCSTSFDVPEPTVLPLERFAEGLELFRRRDALKVVFTP